MTGEKGSEKAKAECKTAVCFPFSSSLPHTPFGNLSWLARSLAAVSLVYLDSRFCVSRRGISWI